MRFTVVFHPNPGNGPLRHTLQTHEAAETTGSTISNILIEVAPTSKMREPERLMSPIYVKCLSTNHMSPAPLKSDTEVLTINMDEVDCTTFIDNVAARKPLLLGEGRTS